MTESRLNLFGQLDKIDLGDSRFGFDHDAISLDMADGRVFVFFPLFVLKSSASARKADNVAKIAMIIFRRECMTPERLSAFIRSHNETFSVVAMCVCNPDRSPVGINR